jgi:hypothetical protein
VGRHCGRHDRGINPPPCTPVGAQVPPSPRPPTGPTPTRFPTCQLDEVIMNIFSVPLRHSSARAAHSETGWPMTWITPRTAQIDTALTSLSRRWRRRWCAGWLATVFLADHRATQTGQRGQSRGDPRAGRPRIRPVLTSKRDRARFAEPGSFPARIPLKITNIPRNYSGTGHLRYTPHTVPRAVPTPSRQPNRYRQRVSSTAPSGTPITVPRRP